MQSVIFFSGCNYKMIEIVVIAVLIVGFVLMYIYKDQVNAFLSGLFPKVHVNTVLTPVTSKDSVEVPVSLASSPDDVCDNYPDTTIIGSLPLDIQKLCNKKWWKDAGCTTAVEEPNAWQKSITKKDLIADNKLWSVGTDSVHRIACYGKN